MPKKVSGNRLNICLVDPLSPYGHKDVNRVLIEQLNEYGELTILCSNSLIDEKIDDVNYIQYNDDFFTIGKNPFWNRVRLIRVLTKMSEVINSESFDIIIFSSYEVLTTYFGFNILHLITKSKYPRVYILNHSNIDDIDNSKIKQFAYRRLNKCITNIVYEDYIGEHIQKNYNKKWIKVRHNINNYKLFFRYDNVKNSIKDFFSDTNMKYIIVPGMLSNQSEFMNQIILLDKENYFTKHRIKIFIKAKAVRYKSNYIYCFNEYLSDDEYSFLFERCNYVSIIYSSDYKYRVSGIYFDAVTFVRPIIFSSNMFFDCQRKRFGDIGINFTGILKDALDQITDERYEKEYKVIKEINNYYSDKNLKTDLQLICK